MEQKVKVKRVPWSVFEDETVVRMCLDNNFKTRGIVRPLIKRLVSEGYPERSYSTMYYKIKNIQYLAYGFKKSKCYNYSTQVLKVYKELSGNDNPYTKPVIKRKRGEK